jgi:hypothetical protein
MRAGFGAGAQLGAVISCSVAGLYHQCCCVVKHSWEAVGNVLIMVRSSKEFQAAA